jgi:hypothetical protein
LRRFVINRLISRHQILKGLWCGAYGVTAKGDILKKSEKKLDLVHDESETPKRKPGGQPGHPGKTRKGFGRVDPLKQKTLSLTEIRFTEA